MNWKGREENERMSKGRSERRIKRRKQRTNWKGPGRKELDAGTKEGQKGDKKEEKEEKKEDKLRKKRKTQRTHWKKTGKENWMLERRKERQKGDWKEKKGRNKK